MTTPIKRLEEYYRDELRQEPDLIKEALLAMASKNMLNDLASHIEALEERMEKHTHEVIINTEGQSRTLTPRNP